MTRIHKPQVKGVQGTVPFRPEYELVDLSLATRGDQEDKEFAENPVLRFNLRRGNTLAVVICEIVGGKYVDSLNIIQEKNRPHEIATVHWVRKGLRKFFDMCLPYVQQANTQNLDGLGSFDGNFGKVYRGRDEYLEELRKVIFFEVEQSMTRDRASIDVYKTNKANGENAQVSYCREMETWIIASKNVSLAARSPADLELYSQTRYSFALLIAQEWFRLISPLSPARLSALQAALTNHTIVGEYVGHPDHQHLVRYTSKDILFYAYVDHNSDYTCLPPAQAFALFREFGLSHVKVQLYGCYARPTELYAALESLFMQTSKEDIDEGEEGSVLYFVRNERPDRQDLKEFIRQVLAGEESSLAAETQREAFSTQHTLSLAKLKTLEYRLYRKLREKLKHFKPEKSVDDVLRIYKKEVRDLIEGQELPRPLDFYFEVASVALAFIARNPKAQDKLQEHYIDFLDKIVAGVNEGNLDLKGEESQDVVEIVLITPPEVVPNGQIRALAEELNYEYKRVKDWNENRLPKEKSLFHLIHAQKLSARFDKKALVVQVGFGETGQRECLQALGRLRAAGTRIEDEEVARLVGEGDLEARVGKLFEDVNSRENQLLHVHPTHILVLPSLEGAVAAIQQRLSLLSAPLPPPVPSPASQDQTQAPVLTSAIRIPASNGKRVLVIVPMGIPGMGKTYLVQRLEAEVVSLGCSFSIVSSDQVRRGCMEEYMARTRTTDLEKAFDSTAKKAREVFYDRVKEGLRSSKQVHVLFIDKNHPPNAVSSTLKELSKIQPKGISKLELVALVPDCTQKFTNSRGMGSSEYELSFTFLVQCLKRTIGRQEHETMVGSPAKKAAVVLMMFSMYRDVRFSDLLRQGFDHILRVPFTDESKVHYPEPLVDSIADILANLKPGSMPEEQDTQSIVTALNFIPNQFSVVNSLGPVLTSLTDIVRRQAAPPLPPLQEPMQVDAPVARRQAEPLNLKQMPMYLGIDVELWLGPGLLGFLRSCLFALARTYTRDEDLKSDYEDLIADFYSTGYQSGLPISEKWQFPKSLHLTTKYIGPNKQAASSDPAVKSFRVNEEVSLCARLFAYVPQKIMCVLVDVLTADIPVANKFPHVTCLLGKWPAKCSNDVLNGISFEAEMNKQRATICGEEVTVYTIRLQPELAVKGLTKAFF